MFTKIGRLLTTNIGNYDLYNFSKRFIAKVLAIMGDNTSIAPYVTAVSNAAEEMKKVFSRNLKNPLTVKINNKDRERVNLLIAFRRKIGTAQLMVANPTQVEAANSLKKEMEERGWWKFQRLSYGKATGIISALLDTMSQELFAQWVVAAELQSTLDNLKQAQAEFEVLENERIDLGNSDTTPQMIAARKKLADVVLAMLTAIDFGVESDPGSYAEIGEYAIDMIVEVNAKTLTRQTLAKNGEDEPVDEGTESESDGETESEAEEGAETEPEGEDFAEEETLEGGPAYG